MKTRLEIYKELYQWYANTYSDHIVDLYEGQNRVSRIANIYAIKNTNTMFYKQKKEK